MTFVQPDSAPEGVALLVNTGAAGRDTTPKIRTVFTAKALAPPENCWFPPSPSSSLQHQALARLLRGGTTKLSQLFPDLKQSPSLPRQDYLNENFSGQE